jgi:hypothetical protein
MEHLTLPGEMESFPSISMVALPGDLEVASSPLPNWRSASPIEIYSARVFDDLGHDDKNGGRSDWAA